MGHLFCCGKKRRMNSDQTTMLSGWWYHAFVVTIFVLRLMGRVRSEALVDIINYCEEPITVHCKSHDSDLGRVMIDVNEDFMFKFTANIFGTTLFWCSFEWGIENQYFPVWKGFDYIDRPPCSQAGGSCLYKVAPDGFYWATSSKAEGQSFWTFYKKWSSITDSPSTSSTPNPVHDENLPAN